MKLARAILDFIDVILEEEICDIVNERGYDCFFGKEEEEITDFKIDQDLESVNTPNVDIFGQVVGKKSTFEIQCPNCKRTLAAVRFAPHLEKCMGMGRNSSRIASRRLAASAGNSSSSAFASSLDTQRTSPGPINGSTSTVSQVASYISNQISLKLSSKLFVAYYVARQTTVTLFPRMTTLKTWMTTKTGQWRRNGEENGLLRKRPHGGELADLIHKILIHSL